jgi:hypothetical protein
LAGSAIATTICGVAAESGARSGRVVTQADVHLPPMPSANQRLSFLHLSLRAHGAILRLILRPAASGATSRYAVSSLARLPHLRTGHYRQRWARPTASCS